MVKLQYYGFSKQLQAICTKTSNSKFIKTFPNELKTIASNQRVASMSAIQIGSLNQYFILLTKQYLKKGQWSNYGKIRASNYRQMFNAEITSSSNQKIQQWEQCASYPKLKMLIQRPVSIFIKYMDEDMVVHHEEVDGFQARVLQHEVEHNFGADFIRKSTKIQIVDPQLREKYQTALDEKLQKYRNSVQSLEADQKNFNNPQFFQLKQFLTYSIIDLARKK